MEETECAMAYTTLKGAPLMEGIVVSKTQIVKFIVREISVTVCPMVLHTVVFLVF